MPYRVEIEPIVPGGIRRVAFDFAPFLAADEVLDSYTVVINLVSGVDDDPNEVLGDNSVAGVVVYQFLAPTIEGNIYSIQAVATTTEGQIVTLSGHLACVETFDRASDTQVEPVPGGGAVGVIVARYDSGNITAALSPTVIMTAAENEDGGVYQVNPVMSTITPTGGFSGNISGYVIWTDADANTLEDDVSFLGVEAYAAGIGIPGATRPIHAKAGTQILVKTEFFGVSGTPTYRYQVQLVRLS